MKKTILFASAALAALAFTSCSNEVDPFEITELTLTGQLNGTDFQLIRAMAGNDYLGQPTDGKLKKLDLSGANIVEGGEKYLDTNQITSSTGAYIQDIGENSFHFATQNNVLGSCLFAGCDKLRRTVLPDSLREMGYDAFTSSLFISPYQKHDLMRQVAEDAAARFGVTFLYRDFRPYFKAGQERARALGFYMQKYCGCVFSEEERYLKANKILR